MTATALHAPSRRVPLARRALFQDRRRALLATGGVAAALLLVLLLDGISNGAKQQVTAYLRASPAQVIVAQTGVHTMHMSVSALPPDTAAKVRAVRGVAWAEELQYVSSTLNSATGRQLSYVFGYDPAGRLGPRSLTGGRPAASGEALVDEIAAGRLGVKVGGRVEVLGQWFTVSGLYTGGTSMINTITFIPAADFTRLRGATVAYVFAGAGPGVTADELAGRVATAVPAVAVQTKARFVHEEAALVGDMAADIVQIMSLAGFLIALAVIGLTLYTLTLAKLREHAVIKALGSRNRGVGRIVLTQALWAVGAALALATVLGVAVASLISRLSPANLIAITPGSVARAGVAALIVGALGSIVPLRRVFNVDPATAFRRAS